MKIKLTLTLITTMFVLTIPAEAGDIHWRVSTSGFDISPEANTGHVVVSALMADYFDRRGLKWWQSDLLTLGFGVLWEVKDGYFFHEDVPILGAEGFSMMDLKLDVAGIILNRSITLAISQYHRYKYKKARQLRLQFQYY